MASRIRVGTVIGSKMAPNEEAVIESLHKLLKSKVKFDLIVNSDYSGEGIEGLDLYWGEKSSFSFLEPERFRETVETFWSTHSYIQEKNPDILFHLTKPFLYGFVAAVLGKIHRIPSVVRVGGEVFRWHKHYSESKTAQYFISDYLPAFITFRWANCIVSIGENLVRMLEETRLPPEKVTIIRQPVDKDLFYSPNNKKELRRELDIHPDKRVVLIIGMGKVEGVGYFPKIVEKATQEVNDLFFVIVGAPTGYQEVIKEEYGDYVRIEGRVPHSKMPKYYQASDLLMHLSTTEGSITNTVLEAISCGLPVVGTSVGDMEKYIPTYDSPEGFARFLTEGQWPKVDLPSEFENATIQKRYMEIFKSLV